MQKLAIISIGTELTNGETLNTTGQWMAQILHKNQYNIPIHLNIEDDKESIISAIKYCQSQGITIMILTGGLGATNDDITIETLAQFTDQPVIFNKEVYTTIEDKLTNRKKPIHSSTSKMALLPNGAMVIPNDLGLAPGCCLSFSDTTFFVLPGVPFECKQMFTQYVIPQILAAFPTTITNYNLDYVCGGIGETGLEKLLQPQLDQYKLKSSYLPDLGLVRINIQLPKNSKTPIYVIEQEIEYVIGQYILSKNDNRSIAELLIAELNKHSLTIATAESCTGGILTHLLTNVSGSSKVVMGGVNTYSTQSKIDLLTIDTNIIEKYTVYSPEVANLMAEQTQLKFKSNISISTTGILEQDDLGHNANAHFSISSNYGTEVHNIILPYDRVNNKMLLANSVFITTINYIKKYFNYI